MASDAAAIVAGRLARAAKRITRRAVDRPAADRIPRQLHRWLRCGGPIRQQAARTAPRRFLRLPLATWWSPRFERLVGRPRGGNSVSLADMRFIDWAQIPVVDHGRFSFGDLVLTRTRDAADLDSPHGAPTIREGCAWQTTGRGMVIGAGSSLPLPTACDPCR